MTEHSVDELKRQWQSARDRLAAASKSAGEAEEAMKAGILAASGLGGHVVEAGHPWRAKTTVKMLVEGVAPHWGKFDLFYGKAIKKDGTPGLVRVEALIEGARDLGAYTQ